MTELKRPRGAAPTRPITLAILAMGGEGGGVLADWLVALAQRGGYLSQLTSVPGVAQRTGATIYYLELFPDLSKSAAASGLAARQPVLALMPAPGEVDVVIASELMEAGRAIQRGLVSRDRTTLIASSHRIYSMTEKIAMGDGRVDSVQLMRAISAAPRSLVSADFAEMARANASVISAPLFGALAGSGALPFSRGEFEQALSAGGVGVKASLAAFAAAFEVAAASVASKAQSAMAPVVSSNSAAATATVAATPTSTPAQANRTVAPADSIGRLGPRLQGLAASLRNQFHPSAHEVLVHAVLRLADYQDEAYAETFLQRLKPIAVVDRGGDQAELLSETARHLALWMSYEDTIRVADLKTRSSRFTRVATEQGVADGQLLNIREFLHPRVEEIADTLPVSWGRALLASPTLRGWLTARTQKGRIVQTNSIRGYLMLYTIAGLRRWRRKSLRYSVEQAHIERWLAAIQDQMSRDYPLAVAIARLQRLVKGYGDTHSRGFGNFQRIFEHLPRIASAPGAAALLQTLTEAALADESGGQLTQALSKL